jgi:hypothetical protein
MYARIRHISVDKCATSSPSLVWHVQQLRRQDLRLLLSLNMNYT